MEKKLELGSGPILVRRPYVWYPCCLKLIFFLFIFPAGQNTSAAAPQGSTTQSRCVHYLFI